MAQGTFATAVNCMDGRTQECVSKWLKDKHDVDYVDTITEPGADKALTQGPDWQVNSIRNRVKISVEGHGSKVIAVAGHHDCAGNPVPKEVHLEQTKKAMDILAGWYPNVTVYGVWVGDDWQVQVISEHSPK